MRRALAVAMVAGVISAARADDHPKGAPDAGQVRVEAADAGRKASRGSSRPDGGTPSTARRQKAPAKAERTTSEKDKPCEEIKPCAIE